MYLVFGLLNFRVSEIYDTGIEICQKNLQAFSNICIVRGKVSRCFRSFLFEKKPFAKTPSATGTFAKKLAGTIKNTTPN